MKFTFTLISLVLLTACISVNVGGKKAKRAEDVRFNEPAKPFESFSSEYTDHAWKTKNSGSSISFVSECGGDDIGLESLKSRPLAGLESLTVVKDEPLTFNDRKAYRTSYTGELDGVKTAFDILVFKKNSCSFILTYVSTPVSFKKDLPAFDKFLKTFEAP